MNTTTLSVGQLVEMVSGPYGNSGKVVKVTPEGVEVEIVNSWPGTGNTMLLKFDTNGKECTFDLREYPNAWMGTYEGGPWKLAEIL